jgi:hypothetical protein
MASIKRMYADANDRVSHGVRLKERDAAKLLKKHSDLTQRVELKAESAEMAKLRKEITALQTRADNIKAEAVLLVGAATGLAERLDALGMEMKDE